jgi:Adenine specific DNA methylase Mod
MIYIDPPYNTGNDFIYRDDFRETSEDYVRRTGQVDELLRPLTTNPRTGGRFHSTWLNMMYPRLLLARTLLREDGVIFVSIDDNELHNLRQVMDEIFGAEQFVSIITVQTNPRGRTLDRFIAKTHEYIVIYTVADSGLFQVAKDERQLAEYDLVAHPVNKGKIGAKRKLTHAPPTPGTRDDRKRARTFAW